MVVPLHFDLFSCKCILCHTKPLCCQALVCLDCKPLLATGGSLGPLPEYFDLDNRIKGRRGPTPSEAKYKSQTTLVPKFTPWHIEFSIRDVIEARLREVTMQAEIIIMAQQYLDNLTAAVRPVAKPRKILIQGRGSEKLKYQHDRKAPNIKPPELQQSDGAYVAPHARVYYELTHAPLQQQLRESSLPENKKNFYQLNLFDKPTDNPDFARKLEEKLLTELEALRATKTATKALEFIPERSVDPTKLPIEPKSSCSWYSDPKEQIRLTKQELREEAAFSKIYNEVDWAAIEKQALALDQDDDCDYEFSVDDIYY